MAILLSLPLGLGLWQLDRRAWKADLLADIARQRSAPALDLSQPDALGLRPADHRWRAARAEGRFRHDLEMVIHGRARRDRPGVHVATPLVLADGRVVMVDRGWVPLGPRLDRPPAVDGPVVVVGVLTPPERPGWFTPESRPDRREFFHADLAGMAEAAGLGPVLPMLLEAGAPADPGELPLGGQTRMELPNDHLRYAVTWFTLAAVGAVMFGWRVFARRAR